MLVEVSLCCVRGAKEVAKFWFVKQMCSRYEGTMELKFNIRREPRFPLQYMLLSFLFVFVDIGVFFCPWKVLVQCVFQLNPPAGRASNYFPSEEPLPWSLYPRQAVIPCCGATASRCSLHLPSCLLVGSLSCGEGVRVLPSLSTLPGHQGQAS